MVLALTFSPFQKMLVPTLGVTLFSTKTFEQAPKINFTSDLSLSVAVTTFVLIYFTTPFPEDSTEVELQLKSEIKKLGVEVAEGLTRERSLAKAWP